MQGVRTVKEQDGDIGMEIEGHNKKIVRLRSLSCLSGNKLTRVHTLVSLSEITSAFWQEWWVVTVSYRYKINFTQLSSSVQSATSGWHVWGSQRLPGGTIYLHCTSV